MSAIGGLAAWRAIGLLAKSQGRHVIRHPIGALATLVGVTLAVFAVVVVHLVAQSLRADLRDAGRSGMFAHTHVATRTNLTEADYFDLRRRWRQGELPSVAELLPIMDGHVMVNGRTRRLVGFDPLAALANPAVAGLDVPRGFLTGDVVVAGPDDSQTIGASDGIVGGMSVTVQTVADLEVLLADLPTAQRLLKREAELDALWLRVANTRSRLLDWADELLPGIAAALPTIGDPVVPGYRVTAVERWNPARRFADAQAFNLGVLAFLSVLMATFLAVEASATNAARRRGELERLFAMGVGRAALRGTLVAEGFVVGVLGAGAGYALGVIGAGAIAADTGLPATPSTWWVGAKAFLCGTLAAGLAAALAPVWLQPVTAIRAWRRHGMGALALALVVACLVRGSLVGAFTALLALCYLHVAYVVPAFATAVSRLAAFAKTAVAKANLRAAPVALAEADAGGGARLALGALSVAAAATIGMGLMVESFRNDFHDMLDAALWEGVHVRAGPGEPAFDLAWIRALPECRDARRYGEARAQTPAGPITVRLAALDDRELARYDYSGPAPDAMVNEAGARFLGLRAGDVTQIKAGRAAFKVTVAHVFRDFRAVPTVILPMTLRGRFESGAIAWNQVTARSEPGAATALTNRLALAYPSAEIRDHATIRGLAEAAFDRSFAVSNVLTLVTMLVAVVGLYAALAAQQEARQREFRLLAALGYARSEIWRLAMTRTVVLGTVAALAALPLAVAIAWVLCALVNPQAFGWSIDLRLEARAFAAPVALCVAAALAGAPFRVRASPAAAAEDGPTTPWR